jgi:ATP-dependent RNA helicase SUPV3L1/SUV3
MLSLAVWQVDVAVASGLLARSPDGRFDPRAVDAAREGGSAWLAMLELEYRLNATDAAVRLGISPKVFARLAAERELTIVDKGRWKHGTVLYYRAGDVDKLTDVVAARGKSTPRARNARVAVSALAGEYGVTSAEVERAARSAQAKVQRETGGELFITVAREHDVRQALAAAADPQSSPRAADRRAGAAHAKAEAKKVAARVTVHVRDRHHAPKSVTLHLGPTNSGKTYDALQRLAQSGSGVYAAPLRMLAREAYEKMCLALGVDNVGLITGEEQINPDAPVLCCTAEMAPMSGTTLVLDEAHWAADPERGYAWTRLLVGAQFEIIEVAASMGAELFLTAVFSDVPALDIVRHTRLSPLAYGGDVAIAKVPDRSLVVAFSRKGVHALARRFLDQGRTVGVLYGALPPETRIDQIRKFMAGEVDVLVCTDVVGHGINTPAEAVVFAQTDKYDGTAVRDLLTWEAAQIGGRAGRYGLGGAGRVFTLTGASGFTPDSAIVRAGTAAAAGREPDGLRVERGLLRPTYRDLGEAEAHELGVALTAWATVAERELAERPGVEPVPVAVLAERWEAAADVLGIRRGPAGLTRGWPIDGQTVWQVLTTPVDLESPAFPALLRSLADGTDRFELVLQQAAMLASTTLDGAEAAAGIARDLMVIARQFVDVRPGLYDTAVELERRATATIGKRLDHTLRTSSYGTCERCGAECAPHFRRCDKCHAGVTELRPPSGPRARQTSRTARKAA